MNLIAKTLRIVMPIALIGVMSAALIGISLAVYREKPPIATVQIGYRGTAMEQNYNERMLDKDLAKNTAPVAAKPIKPRPGAPLAKDVYENIQVLGDLNTGEFGRTMNAMTEWVSPEQGCAYCHVEGNFADDSKYAKTVARRMLEMTKHINAEWKTHVAETGVTCYTCHRGKNVPAEIWFKPKEGKSLGGSMADSSGQNKPAKSVAYTSLPLDPFTPYLLGNSDIRVNGTQALKVAGSKANLHSTKQAEHTYGLMIHMSGSLGVNCTYCHNTRSFSSWEGESTPMRATAWYGIRMTRDLNNDYLVPLAPAFPANRLGPAGDGPKLNCATCHQGAFKPLYGAAMAKDYPALKAPENFLLASTAAVPTGDPVAATAPAPATATATATAPVAPPVAVAPAALPSAATLPAAAGDKDVEAAVRIWAAAWSGKDVSGYLAAYGKDFEPQGKQAREQWEEERRKRIVGKSRISVKLTDLAVSESGVKAVVSFRQQYDADALSLSSRKVLDMVKVGDRWVIVRESTGY